MKFSPTAIPDVLVIEPRVHKDRRGHFFESWNARAFAAAGIEAEFVQDNQSRSGAGSLRGLHYQVGRRVQGKLVRVIRGEVFDVAVDLRRSSPTFGRWVSEQLSDENHRMLWIPPGFAHGFYVTGETAEFVYKCTDFYSPADERTLRWDDPEVGIVWPLVEGRRPIVSDKDAAGDLLRDAELFP